MSPPQPQTLSMIFGLDTKDALLSLAAILGPVLGYFAARYTATAPLQASLNDAFRTLMDQWQERLAQLTVRNSELEAEVLRQRGVINSNIQSIDSLNRNLERKQRFVDDLVGLCVQNDIKIPTEWHQ